MGKLPIPALRGASRVKRIDVGPALEKSRVSMLHGRPYPVQFRNQGAFDAWRHALGTTEATPALETLLTNSRCRPGFTNEPGGAAICRPVSEIWRKGVSASEGSEFGTS